MNENQLYERIEEISKTIFSYCMSKTSCREDADDLSQDILYELLKSSRNLRNDDAFYGFMWAVAGNVYKQWYRKKLMRHTVELSEDIPDSSDCFDDGDTDSDIYLLRRELALLSEKYRRATILYYIEHRSCAEISQMLTISESMVKYLLFKSRKILKEGLNMDRNLGELSYCPKSLIAMYNGEGPNRFWNLMQSKIKQNILSACYNDSLNEQQISLETGIPLPYLEDDIRELESKKIIIRDGTRYKANVIIITSDCADEIERAAIKYHGLIADTMEHFINSKLDEYKSLGFVGNDFSENTLRWQLAVIMFMMLSVSGFDKDNAPVTAWGERAYLWCVEESCGERIFNYCGVNSKNGDGLYFFDYLKGGKGDHHDFYGNERYVNIFCDICRGKDTSFGEYDLDAIAEMIREGYVIVDDNKYKATVPVYTFAQYQSIINMVREFISAELDDIIKEMDNTTCRILGSHTPKHLQNQICGIAANDRFVNAVCAPASRLIEKHVLDTAWNALEMPTTYVVLGE